MIIPQKMRAKLASREEYNQRFCLYRFELISPYQINNLAGQYVLIQIDKKTTRAYSMCDRPDVNTSFELLIDYRPQGLGVKYLQNLNYGDEIELLAPLGQMVLTDLTGVEEIVLVATASGIAPMRSIITDLLQLKHSQIPLTLFWGMRSDTDFFWLDDFLQMQIAFPYFNFIPTVTHPTAVWTLKTGRVTEHLETHNFAPQSKFLLCGQTAMITQAQEILQNKGFNLKQIISEKFTTR